MPFTLSHAVAILPLATGGPVRLLVPAALVIGSWIPDLPYFIPFLLNSDATHAASGPVTIDLLLGLVVFALWELVLRRPLADLAPEALRERLPTPALLNWRRWGSAAVSVVLGAITHVVWDTFSPPGRWGTTHLSVLQVSFAGLPLFKWVQYGSGGLGLAGLAVCWCCGSGEPRGMPGHPVPATAPGLPFTQFWSRRSFPRSARPLCSNTVRRPP